MQSLKTIISIAIASFIMTNCGPKKKEGDAAINDKKAALEKLKAERNKNDEEIRKLQEELDKIDTNSVNEAKIKLVAVTPVVTQDFKHYIDLRGRIDAEQISYITPRGMGGQVKAVYVKEGEPVRKGQLLLKLDDAIQGQAVIAAKQQLEGLKTQLSFAKNLYERQKNLWEKGIGTEVQLLSAQTNAKGLEDQLKAATEQIKVAVEQQNMTNIYSDVSGIADIVNVKVGEIFTGMGQIKIVNTSNLKVIANIPENYVGKVRKGSALVINVADINKSFNSSLSVVSQSIDPISRGFIAEAKIPSDPLLKPNQTAVLRLLDYQSTNALVIPVNTLQTDEKGKYVYVMENRGNGRFAARKRNISIGEVYGENAEVKSGLAAGEQLITEGYQNLYDGQLISSELK